MLEIRAQEKIKGVWTNLEIPELLSERVAAMSAMAGRDVVIEIKTSVGRTFLCGSDQTMAVMRKAHPTGRIVMGIRDAHDMLEYAPDKFCTTIQVFSKPEDVAVVFPPKQGWAKPAEAQ